MSRKFWVALAAVTAMLLSQAPIASAWAPAENATFNIPKPWGSRLQRTAIVRKVEAMVNHAPRGSTIVIATYLFDRPTSVDALIHACKRGVSVRVILDGHIDNRQSRRLVAALNGDNIHRDGHGGFTQPRTWKCGRDFPNPAKQARPLNRQQTLASLDDPTAADVTWGTDQSYVKKCHNSCRGTGASMHSKFYGFSQTGTAHNVVMVSSSNLNSGGTGRGWNDAFTMKNRPNSFAMYEAIHREMTQDDPNDDRGKFEITDGPYISRFFPWPGNAKPDPVVHDLRQVGCHTPSGRTRVNVSMFWWKGTRGNHIATELLNLAHNGCAVNIIYGAPSLQIAARLRDAARNHVIGLYDSRWWNLDSDPDLDVRTHSKYILVNGRYGTNPHGYRVMMGTANWNPGSLTQGDENTLNISGYAPYRQYINNWDMVRRHSKRVPFHQ